METTKICLLWSYSQLDKHVSRLATSAINDDRRCRSGRDRRSCLLHGVARLQSMQRVSPASP